MNSLETIKELILCSILRAHVYNNIDLDVVMTSGIIKEWFDDADQGAMFEVMKVIYLTQKKFDEAIILSYMEKSGVKNPETLLLRIMALTGVPQRIVMEYIDILKENYSLKTMGTLSTQITKMLGDSSNTSAMIMQTVQNILDSHLVLNNTSVTRSLREVRADRKSKPDAVRIATGIPFIDTVLTDKKGNVGIRNEGLFYVSGLKQSGKTFILTRLIENVSKEHPVIFGTLEFGEDLYDENIEGQEELGTFDGNIDNIYTFDSIYNIDAICAEIRLAHKLKKIKLGVIDSKMRVTNENKSLGTDERRISETFVKLGKLSKELKIPIIIIVQTSKEDTKSTVISVKGSMDADHEAYVWIHITKIDTKSETDNELRSVVWVKNKDTHKHPKQHLMFVPETSDFYRVELDENGYPAQPLDKYRKPAVRPIEIVYETKAKGMVHVDESDLLKMEGSLGLDF